MNKVFKKFGGVVFVAALAAQALPADLTGKWVGKMVLDGTAMKKHLQDLSGKATPEQKKQIANRIKLIDESIQFVDKTKIRLDLKKAGVAFIEFDRNGKKEPEWCKWILKAKKLTLNGFTGGGDALMAMDGVVSNGEKTIVFDMSFVIEKQMSMQGLKSILKPKMTLTFQKS